MKRNQIVLLYGMPASGKYTMARRLRDTDGGALLDNHYFHDMFAHITEIPDETRGLYFHMVAELRNTFLDILRNFYPREKKTRYIFTSVLVTGDTLQERLDTLAQDMDADYIPIELVVGVDTLAARCETEYRKSRKKLANADNLRNAIKTNLSDPLIYDHPNKLTIESDNLSEDETFALIQEHLKKFE